MKYIYLDENLSENAQRDGQALGNGQNIDQ